MKRILTVLFSCVISMIAISQEPWYYMIETSDQEIFIMWERKVEGASYLIFRTDSNGMRRQLNTYPIKPVKTRLQLEEIFGADMDRICRDFDVKYPEQIFHEVEKRPDLFYIMQAVEPRLCLVYGNGFFDGNVDKGGKYTYEVDYLDKAGNSVPCFSSPVVVAKDRLPEPSVNLDAQLDSYNHVLLYWDDVETNHHAGYNVYRSENPDGTFRKVNLRRVLLATNQAMPLGRQSAFTDENVEPGKTYHYKVNAVNILGDESPDSEIINISLPPKTEIADPFKENAINDPGIQ